MGGTSESKGKAGLTKPPVATGTKAPATMPDADHLDLVRFRNDGDDFHILWTARRALRILWPQSGLKAVAVEGISDRDRHLGKQITAGLLVADTVEYYGGETPIDARLIIVNQLKFSTTAADSGWPVSGLKDTLAGFAKRYTALVVEMGAAAVAERYRFRFVTNRPLSAELKRVLEAARRNNATGLSARAATSLRGLRTACGMNGRDFASFLKLVEFSTGEASRQEQSRELGQTTERLQPALYVHATAGLKEMVRSQTMSDAEHDPTIRKETVLRAFGLEDERDLFPAQPQFEDIAHHIPHHQEAELAASIAGAEVPVIVSAPGGVGKSALARRLPELLPEGSEAVIFDGFAGGTYRAPSQPRHLHQLGLVQIANELAARGLCDPLLPGTAEPHALIRALRHRLSQAAATVRSRSDDAVILIVLDAADNSQTAADLAGDRCFVQDLMQEAPPENCRIVALARPERVDRLKLPPSVLPLQLEPFLTPETAALVRARFPEADAEQVAEFHRLTFGNPRVQANQLSASRSMAEAIDRLGPQGLDVAGLIAQQLDTALNQLREAEPDADVDTLCTALAALPPLVPIDVIARVAGIAPGAIISFAADFAGGRPLLLHGDNIQFRDEPVEFWFQSNFAPSPEAAKAFAARLEPLARSDGYAAMALPGLLHAAGQYDRLFELALDPKGFLSDDPVEKRHVVLQQVRFALKAAFARARLTDAVKLLIRAGEEIAASERQSAYLTENADLVARLAGPQVVDDFVFRRRAGGGAWFGSANAYSAAMLAADAAKLTEARAYLRLAERWLDEWVRLPSAEKANEPLDARDLAAMAFAKAICDGPAAAADFLRRAKHPKFAFEIAGATAQKLLDNGRSDLLIGLLEALGDGSAALSCVAVLHARCIDIPGESLRAVAAPLIAAGKLPVIDPFGEIAIIEGAVSLAEALIRTGLADEAGELAGSIKLPVPQHPFPDPYGRLPAALRAAALRERAGGATMDAEALWRTDRPNARDEEASHEFTAMCNLLIPWFRFRLKALAGEARGFDAALDAAEADSRAHVSFAGDYREQEIRSLRFVACVEAMAWAGAVSSERLAKLEKAVRSGQRKLWPRECLRAIAVLGGNPALASDMLRLAEAAVEATEAERQDAGSTAAEYANVARALVGISREDAAAYFAKGVEIADRVGDELHDRLWMLLGLARRAADGQGATPEDSHRLVRAAELFQSINDHKFPWHDVFEVLAVLDPASAIAASSRLDNRRVTFFDRTLAPVLEHLSGEGKVRIGLKVALALIDAYWRHGDLKDKLAAEPPEQRAKIVNYLANDAIHLGEDAYRLRALVGAAKAYGLLSPELEAVYERRRQKDRYVEDWSPSPAPPRPSFDFKMILGGVDLTDPEALSGLLDRQRAHQDGPTESELFEAMRAYVSPSERASHVRALGAAESLSVGSLTEALEGVSGQWTSSPSVKAEVGRAVGDAVKLRALELAASSYLWTSYLPRLAALAGLEVDDLVRPVAEYAAGGVERLSSGALFGLAARIGAQLLSPKAALETCRFALDRLEPLLREKDGDGPWHADLEPPQALPAAFAGLLWIQLGAPEAPARWRAAHCVRRLASLGEQEVLDALIGLAGESQVAPFIDRELPFYEQHARLFLAIALARAAAETPPAVAPYAGFLKEWASRDNKHIFLRHHAGHALLALSEQRAIQLDDAALAEIHGSLTPRGTSPAVEAEDDDDGGAGSEPLGDRDYVLPFDFDKHYSRPLSDAFDLTEKEVSRRVSDILINEWKVATRGKWIEDPRAERGYYRDRGRRRARIDSLSEYLGHHAAAVAAGRLLDERGFSAPYGEERWKSWVEEHMLAIGSGSWLADRRDPTPLQRAVLEPDPGGRDWMWLVQPADFEARLFPAPDEIILWGDWTEATFGKSETVTIESGLVSPATAVDLLRAAQTGDTRWSFLPFAHSDVEIRRPGFRLTGLVAYSESNEGIDRDDPMAGEVRFPPRRPGKALRRLLRLKADDDQRAWTSDKCQGPALIPRIWSDPAAREDDETPNGSTLHASLKQLLAFLANVRRDLIIMVRIQRRDRWADTKGLDYVKPYVRYFILRADGRLEWLRGSRRVGAPAG